MYERIEDLLRLTLMMQGRAAGVSLSDIQEAFDVSRRTAERLRDAVLRAFPNHDVLDHDAPRRSWRLRTGLPPGLVGDVTAAEMAELRLAASALRRDGLEARAALLEGMSDRLGALLRPDSLRRLDPDVAALLEAEGHAMRPGPQPAIPAALLDTLRHAMLGCDALELRYRRRADGRASSATVEPHGLLFGQRHYLVAFKHGTEGPAQLYALSGIAEARAAGLSFRRREGFDLAAYAAQSFGVYQEPPVEVVLRFAAAAAADARQFRFHPTQVLEELSDGRVELRFRAGGRMEIAWHLFTWGPAVEIVAPVSLRAEYAAMLDAARAALGRDTEEALAAE